MKKYKCRVCPMMNAEKRISYAQFKNKIQLKFLANKISKMSFRMKRLSDQNASLASESTGRNRAREGAQTNK